MRIKEILPTCFAILLISTSHAHAYLDPITASILFQSIIAGIAALIFIIKTKFRQIKSFLFKKKDDDTQKTDKISEE